MNVRLTEKQIDGIILAIQQYLAQMSVKLYLYGSRTKLTAKGGDIDLLLVCATVEGKAELLKSKHKILASIKKNIGNQKIDLLFATEQALTTDDFLQVIFPSAVLLHQFVGED